MMPDRITYYCVSCGKKRLGPLAAEANNLNIPCECNGPIHWSTQQPNVLPFKVIGHNKIKIGDDTYNVYQTTKEKESQS